VLFRLTDHGARAAFCGDIIHHVLQIYAPHWTHMADEWPAEGLTSRRRLLESCSEQGALLFPIHFGAPHVAQIEDGPDGFRHCFVAPAS
jgi:glyoxylase-like metal-dependent hydrolase (beta-lactamase superfamily II)